MTDRSKSSADSWAQEASALPLAFAQVREDPQLDLRLIRQLPASSTVVMIASGGETAIQLGREPLGALYLVDMNQSQLALTRLKWDLAGEAPELARALLGHLPMAADDRARELTYRLSRLELASTSLGPSEFVSQFGPDHAGRYERTFAALRLALQPWQSQLDQLLNSSDPEWATRFAAPETEFGRALDQAFAEVMSLPKLVQLFGTEATQNPRQSFATHFSQRTRVALRRIPASSNPFLWQIFAGRFPEGRCYDWLQPECGGGTPCRVQPIYHHGKMNEVLDELPSRSVDLVHLSNILDWLSPSQAQVTLLSAARVLKADGRVIIRQLNSTLDIPSIPSEFMWDLELGTELESIDRSFFYPGIFVGVRP